jgi:hypothetical protein
LFSGGRIEARSGRRSSGWRRGRKTIWIPAIAIASTAAAQAIPRLAFRTGGPAEPWLASKAKVRSCEDWNRFSGFFSRQRRTMRSSSGGTCGFAIAIGDGSLFRTAFIVSTPLSPLNVRRPVSISCRIAPKEKWSLR